MSSSPQAQIGTLAPRDYSYSVPEALLEEQQPEEEEDEEEIHSRPQLTPQGSGGSGVLMGPDTQKGLEKDTPLDIITTEFSDIQIVGPRFLVSNRIRSILGKGFPKQMCNSFKTSATTILMCMPFHLTSL